MKTQHFEVVLDREPTDNEYNQLYEAGLDDCSFEFGAGQPALLWADRIAPTYDDAVASVLSQLAQCGFRAISVTPDNPPQVFTVEQPEFIAV